jgi:nucleotide-binding universal stress UspA family protein
MFTRILVPTDFSEPSDAALEYARALAEKFCASLHLLHVIEPGYATGAFSNEACVAEAPGAYEMLVKEAQAKFASRVFPSDRARHRVTTEAMTGVSAATIVEYAADQNMDLIVMGTHGRTGLAHLLMGSVAEHVVRTAPCPVLTVRQAPVAQGATIWRSAQISRFDTVPGLG